MYRSESRIKGNIFLPLGFVEPGKEASIVEIRAGKNLLGRLARMGIYIGTRVKVISNNLVGPVIIGIGGNRIGLGRGMCNKIIVKEEG